MSITDIVSLPFFELSLTLKKKCFSVEEMAQSLGTLVALAEDPASAPSTHMAAHHQTERQAQEIRHPLLAPVITRQTVSVVKICRQNNRIHKIKMNESLKDEYFPSFTLHNSGFQWKDAKGRNEIVD